MKLNVIVIGTVFMDCKGSAGSSYNPVGRNLGSKGSVYYDTFSKTVGPQGVFPVNMVDSSGEGDVFFSGTVMGLIRELPLGRSKAAKAIVVISKLACRRSFEKLRG